MSKSKRAKEYAKTIKEGVDMTNKRFVIEVDRKTEMIVSQECYPDYVYNQLVTVASLAEQDAEERAMQAFEEAKERIKAAVRLTFNGCLDSQLLERRLLIFNDLLNEINNGGQSDGD